MKQTRHLAFGVSLLTVLACDRSSTAGMQGNSDAQPLLRLVAELDLPSDFGIPGSAAVYPDGRVALVDESAPHVLIYDGRGQLMTTVGRRGRGPGELAQASWIGVAPPDSLIIYDFGLYRLTWMSPDGRVLLTAQFPTLPERGWPAVVGRLDSGILVVASNSRFTPGQRPRGVFVDSTALFGINPYTGAVIRRWPRLPTHRAYATGANFYASILPLTARTSLTAQRHEIAIALGNDSLVTILGTIDSAVTTLEVPLVTMPISSAERAAVYRSLEEAPPDFREAQRQMLKTARLPQRSPAVTQVLPLMQERWLVRGWAPHGAADVPAAVVRSSGASTLSGSIPAGWHLLGAGAGRVVVARERPDGSYTVGVYMPDPGTGA